MASGWAEAPRSSAFARSGRARFRALLEGRLPNGRRIPATVEGAKGSSATAGTHVLRSQERLPAALIAGDQAISKPTTRRSRSAGADGNGNAVARKRCSRQSSPAYRIPRRSGVSAELSRAKDRSCIRMWSS